MQQETLYYISSLSAAPSRIADAIRSHWEVESVPQVHKLAA